MKMGAAPIFLAKNLGPKVRVFAGPRGPVGGPRHRTVDVGPSIEKLSYGATYGFRSPDRCFEHPCGANFAEKDG